MLSHESIFTTPQNNKSLSSTLDFRVITCVVMPKGMYKRDFDCGCGSTFRNLAELQTHMARQKKPACAAKHITSAFFAPAVPRTPDTLRREEKPAKRARIEALLTDSALGERAAGGVALAPLPDAQLEMAAKEALIDEFASIMVTFFNLTAPARLPSKNQLRTYSHDQLASLIMVCKRSVGAEK